MLIWVLHTCTCMPDGPEWCNLLVSVHATHSYVICSVNDEITILEFSLPGLYIYRIGALISATRALWGGKSQVKHFSCIYMPRCTNVCTIKSLA